MSSESPTDTSGEPDRSTPTDAIESQLTAALDGAETREARYHLRQALQLVDVVDGRE